MINGFNPNKLAGTHLFDTSAVGSGKYAHYRRIGRIGQRLQGNLRDYLADSGWRELFGVCKPLVEPDHLKNAYSQKSGVPFLHSSYDRIVTSLQMRDNNQLPDYVFLQYDFLLPKIGSGEVEEYEAPRGLPAHLILNQTFEYISTSIIDPDIYQAKKITFFIFVDDDLYRKDEVLQRLDKAPELYFHRVMTPRVHRLAERLAKVKKVMVSLNQEVEAGKRSIEDEAYKNVVRQLDKARSEADTFSRFMKVYSGQETIDEFFDINIIRIPREGLIIDWTPIVQKIKRLYLERIGGALPVGVE